MVLKMLMHQIWFFFLCISIDSVQSACMLVFRLGMNRLRVVALFGNLSVISKTKAIKDIHMCLGLAVDMISCCPNTSKFP